jgi:hypothetical protein
LNYPSFIRLCTPYDPDHFGYKFRCVEWNYESVKKRR